MASKKGKKAVAVSEEIIAQNGVEKHENGLTNGSADKSEVDKKAAAAKGRGRPKKGETEETVVPITKPAAENVEKKSAPRQTSKNKMPPAEEKSAEESGDEAEEDSPPQSKKGKGRGRPAKADKTEKVEATVKADKPAKPEKSVKADKSDRAEEEDKTEQVEKVDKQEKVVKKQKAVSAAKTTEAATSSSTEAPAKARGRPKKNV